MNVKPGKRVCTNTRPTDPSYARDAMPDVYRTGKARRDVAKDLLRGHNPDRKGLDRPGPTTPQGVYMADRQGPAPLPLPARLPDLWQGKPCKGPTFYPRGS